MATLDHAAFEASRRPVPPVEPHELDFGCWSCGRYADEHEEDCERDCDHDDHGV